MDIFAMGTEGRLVVVAPDEAAAAAMFAPATDVIRLVESLMSTYREESEISRINREAGGRVVSDLHEHTARVLRLAQRAARLSGGAFDATYAPLRTLWRAAARQGRLPSDDEIAAALVSVGYRKLSLTADGAVRFIAPGMELDLGGIAKGYAIDRAVDALKRAGARAGLVDIGGDVRLFGEREGGGPWRVQVRTPPGVDEPIILGLGPCAVTTSGDYERYFEIEGERFSHIIDPRTGRPVQSVPSVTVVAPEAAAADALSTAISVMGARQGVAMVEELDGVECLVMTRRPDGTVARTASAGFSSLVIAP
jgi:thiamine biosynthesis lipoprotein